VRLSAISTLHEFSLIGYGNSFLARKVPRRYLAKGSKFTGHSDLVYKSVRHYNQRVDGQSRQEAAAARLKDVLMEIQVLTHEPLRRHPNIVNLVGFGWENNRIDMDSHVFRWPFLVLEYAQYGSMVDLFEEENVNFESRRLLCTHVGNGLSALHSCDIVHGDVKLENVLVFPKPNGGYIAKLVDFGFTVMNPQGKDLKTKLRGRSTPWDAPESADLIEWAALHLTDVYSFGFLIWRTICYGHYPFIEYGGHMIKDIQELLIELKVEDTVMDAACDSLDPLGIPHDLKESVEHALQFCLQLTPSRRDLNAALVALG
jgi:serine/threonine protein kinase